jgi:hypothetical protein
VRFLAGWLVLTSIALAVSAESGATQLRSATAGRAAVAAHSTNFPTRGVVVPGKTIGAVALGMTQSQVQARWGHNHTPYGSPTASVTTWLFEYRTGEPLGAAVKFQQNKVVAVFTLGSPAGWGLKGVMMGDPVSNVYNVFGSTGDANCIGYNALTVRLGTGTTSFYSADGVIYGYALTAASQPVCQ